MERINDRGEPYYTHVIPFVIVTDIQKLRSVLNVIYPTPADKLKGFEVTQYDVGDDYNIITWAKDPQNLLEEVKKKDDNGIKKE
ncbi:Ff.00g134330.m01.CDS01 [Fusarium sp. VM40]|nr:Ff.00g134330.m01.CDS01 [Fusarium sp. VM40]